MRSATKIGFIGAGNMAEALIKGLLRNKDKNLKVSAFDPDEKRLYFLEQNYGILSTESSAHLAEACDIIFLAVKPQICDTVLKNISGRVSREKLLLSIMAGISTAMIEGHFPEPPRLIRAMPNTPALIGEGATALCCGSSAEKNGYGHGNQLVHCHRSCL